MNVLHKILIGMLVTAALCSLPVSSAVADDAPSAESATEAKAKAETAVYTAQKAKYEAQVAAEKAKYGPLADYATQGTMTVAANSGKLETALLASEATRAIAEVIAKAIQTTGCSAPKALVITGEADHIAFDAYDSFEAQRRSIEKQLNAAIAANKAAVQAAAGGELAVATSLPAAATLLNIVGNLFRSDYQLSAIELTADDTLLLKAVIAAAKANGVTCPIFAPGLFSSRSVDDTNVVIGELSALDQLRAQAAALLDQNSRMVADLQKQASGKKGEAAKRLTGRANLFASAIADATAAIKRYDDFVTKIGTADDKGVVPLAIVARQAKLEGVLKTGLLLILKANYSGGSEYAKKNFWTFLGSMPFYVSGGDVASYSLIDGSSGSVIAAGVLGQSEPFAKVHKTTERYLRGNPR